MTSNPIKATLLFVLLLAAGVLLSQPEEIVEDEVIDIEPKEIISLIDVAKLLDSKETEIVLSDFEIVSTDNDSELLIDKVFFSLYEIKQKNIAPKKIYFYNCSFNLSDNAPLIFNGWHLSKLNIIGCEFLVPIIFEDTEPIGELSVLIENCIFHDDFKLVGDKLPIANINLRQNSFATLLLIDLPLRNLKLYNCNFDANQPKFTSRDSEKTYYQLNLANGYFGNIGLYNNEFNNNELSNVFSIDMEASEIDELKLIKNQLQTINLSYAEVGKSLLIDSLLVVDYIGILNFDFPESNSNIPWYNLGGEKLSIFYTEESDLVIPYQAKSHEELSDNLKYNDLLSAYTKLNTLYHDRGDISSANGSYVEIKDIETRKQAFTQKINPTLNNLINHKLNVFLRFFSDYATNPGKSLIQSLWIILIFTILYMFTFSRWDGMNYRYYLHQFSRFSEYLTTDKPIDAVFTKEITLNNNDIQELRRKYETEGKEMPRILKLFGGPLHFLGKFRYDIIPGLIKLFNFHPGRWADITTKRKRIWSGFLILFISILFLIYVVIVKFINSLLLSLNSFVVIGFGALPEEDEWFAMYLSIIEGMVGWFLLTIFTITLLSQVLQSV